MGDCSSDGEGTYYLRDQRRGQESIQESTCTMALIDFQYKWAYYKIEGIYIDGAFYFISLLHD